MATSLRCRVSAISAFCQPTTQPLPPHSITNCLVAIIHTKPVKSNFSPKIGCHGNIPQHLWTPSNTMPMAHPIQQPKWHLDRFTCFCTDDHRESLYFIMGHPFRPSKLPLPMGGSGPPSNTRFFGPTRVLHPNGIAICAAVFAGLTSVTDRPTDHTTRSVTISRIYICSTAMQRNK